jgi:predicted PurR-regulated permease PerM
LAGGGESSDVSFRRTTPSTAETGPQELDAAELHALASTFASPSWLRDLGRTSWLLVGFFLLIIGIIWLLGVTSTIVGPLIAAMIVATVATPLVSGMQRHRVPRAAGAALVLLGFIALGVVVLVLVLGGITAQGSDISDHLTAATAKAQSWLEDLGVDEPAAASAKSTVDRTTPQIISTLTHGIVSGIKGLTSLVFGLSLAALSTFFLLKDGPRMRGWIEGHLGVPRPVGRTVTGGVIRSLRGYFRGVTLVAAFNGVVVTLGALVLGVPLAGTIGVVSFVTAYVPYIGAFVAGAFAVLIALGAEGAGTALIMLVIVLLANGLLQNLIQPFLMGSALDLNPLVVLVVTIGAGCIFGMLGLVLAAPHTSAAVHITRDLARARAAAGEVEAEPARVPTTAPT